ncbi:MAG TPA: dephospho-CoA kinase [Candidatus Accumulibacter phosphatis]|nr:MAG: Dephospho-CoA kinase [Candidatus Accumulibacter sp. SK-11]HAY29594.1 dephospho-CoA kinase [Accumulibacter sp.]HCN68625.1 dephospho-CoA kinase [Accumulibacter sp.]HRL74842.1 dephospho-CoA kinase [Candidatus Accumulibacter phosphatis]HRQ95041.1 dephospho-CoA kinase [Candidatus Accumulibacter phosphatis]
MSFVVGLTGGIGSGKSTVADLFAARGAALVDTDLIAHQLTGANGGAMAAIATVFGDTVLRADGGLDRAAMRCLVFADHCARARLEAILHPLIRQRSDECCSAATTAPYVVLVVPLLVESKTYHDRTDRILVVDCSEEMQVGRVMSRSGLTATEVRAIIASQASRDERRQAADDLVVNDGTIELLVPQVESLHRRYLELAASKAHVHR